MAKTRDADSPQEGPPDFVGTPNRVPAAVMGGLALVFVLGVVLSSVGKGEESTGDAGVRAVVVPTADRPRTVAIPPCGTSTQITAANAAAQVDTPGATVVELPVGAQPRVLLIPRCATSTSRAGAKMVASVPSSVFVLAAGARTAVGTIGAGQAKKKKEKKPLEPRSQLIVPTTSQATLVVVPPCTGTGSAERAIVLEPPAGSPTALVAPRC